MRTPLPVGDLLGLLEAAPTRLAEAAAGVPEDRLRARPDPGEWSANEVLAHLRACADVWGTCMERMLVEESPTIRAVNPRTWVRGTDYAELPFAESLRAFSAQRRALLELLRPLRPEGWERSATVTGAGRPLTRTVHGYAQWLATHERPHVAQVERAVAAAARS